MSGWRKNSRPAARTWKESGAERLDNLPTRIPDVEILLSLEPAELAPELLDLARKNRQGGGMFHPHNLQSTIVGTGMAATRVSGYPAAREREVEIAISEAWHYLLVNSLIVPASGMNGQHGWMVVSRRGEKLITKQDFKKFQEAAAFPKSLLHPSIADKVWLALARSELD